MLIGDFAAGRIATVDFLKTIDLIGSGIRQGSPKRMSAGAWVGIMNLVPGIAIGIAWGIISLGMGVADPALAGADLRPGYRTESGVDPLICQVIS